MHTSTRLGALFSALLCAPAVTAQSTSVIVWDAEPVTSGAYDQCQRVLPDDDSGAWTVGTTRVTPQRSDFFLERRRPDGSSAWLIEFGTTFANDSIPGLCSDGAGGVFVAGTLRGSGFADPALGQGDGFLARFGPSGALLWARRVGGSDWDWVRSMVADGAGGVLMCGQTQSAGFGAPAGPTSEGFVARYDASGNEQWVTRVSFSGASTSSLNALTLTAQGVIFAVGKRFSPSSAAAARLDLAGALVWTTTNLSSNIELTSVVADGSGGCVTAGHDSGGVFAEVLRVDSAGALQARSVLPTSLSSTRFTGAFGVARLDNGSFVVAGYAYDLVAPPQHQSAATLFFYSGPLLQFAGLQVFAPSTASRGSFSDAVADGRGGLWVSGHRGVTAQSGGRGWLARLAVQPFLGQPGCVGRPNSTGLPALTRLVGSDVRAENAVTAFTEALPPQSVGYYVASLTPGLVVGAGGSQGDLCLGGAISRFSQPGQVLSASGLGRFHLVLDLDLFPSPTGPTSVVAGATWHFQAWYRDLNPGATSNFSSAASFTTH